MRSWGVGAYAEIHDDETATTATGVLSRAVSWFADRGVRVERVLSDNGSAYKSHAWHDTCRELGIGITAYGVLSRGLISGHYDPSKTGAGDFRAHTPRFQGDNLDRNLQLVETLRDVASDAGVTVAQAAIAWVASRGDDIVPVVGARTLERLAESLGAAEVVVTEAQLTAIEAAIPVDQVAGTRYAEEQMAMLDSEK